MKSLVFICLVSLCQWTTGQTYDLEIAIPNLKSREGEIQIGIYNRAEAFPHVDEQFRVVYLDVAGFAGICKVKDLPAGEYAVALMHDENADKICNTNFLGIPKEGYGFSNNVKPVFAAPSFKDCKILLNRNLKITIRLLY